MASTTLGDVKTNSKVSFINNIPESNVTPSASTDLATKGYIDGATGVPRQVTVNFPTFSLPTAIHVGTGTDNFHSTSTIDGIMYFGNTDVGGTGGTATRKRKSMLIGDATGTSRIDGGLDGSLLITPLRLNWHNDSQLNNSLLVGNNFDVANGGSNGGWIEESIGILGSDLIANSWIESSLFNIIATSVREFKWGFLSTIKVGGLPQNSLNKNYYYCNMMGSEIGDTGPVSSVENSCAVGNRAEVSANNATLICGGTGTTNGYFFRPESSDRWVAKGPGVSIASGEIYIGGGTGANFQTRFVDRRPRCSETALPTTDNDDLVSKSYVTNNTAPLVDLISRLSNNGGSTIANATTRTPRPLTTFDTKGTSISVDNTNGFATINVDGWYRSTLQVFGSFGSTGTSSSFLVLGFNSVSDTINGSNFHTQSFPIIAAYGIATNRMYTYTLENYWNATDVIYPVIRNEAGSTLTLDASNGVKFEIFATRYF